MPACSGRILASFGRRSHALLDRSHEARGGTGSRAKHRPAPAATVVPTRGAPLGDSKRARAGAFRPVRQAFRLGGRALEEPVPPRVVTVHVAEAAAVQAGTVFEVSVDRGPSCARSELVFQLVGLILRELAVGNSLVDRLLGSRNHRIDEAGNGLALLVGDLRERLIREPLAQLGLRQTEVRSRCRQNLTATDLPGAVTVEAGAAVSAAAEQRELVRVDAFLERWSPAPR